PSGERRTSQPWKRSRSWSTSRARSQTRRSASSSSPTSSSASDARRGASATSLGTVLQRGRRRCRWRLVPLAGAAAQRLRERRDQVDRQREDDRGAGARAELEQGLEVAQLDRGRVLADDLGGVIEALGGLELALGVDDLRAALALGLRL